MLSKLLKDGLIEIAGMFLIRFHSYLFSVRFCFQPPEVSHHVQSKLPCNCGSKAEKMLGQIPGKKPGTTWDLTEKSKPLIKGVAQLCRAKHQWQPVFCQVPSRIHESLVKKTTGKTVWSVKTGINVVMAFLQTFPSFIICQLFTLQRPRSSWRCWRFPPQKQPQHERTSRRQQESNDGRDGRFPEPPMCLMIQM